MRSRHGQRSAAPGFLALLTLASLALVGCSGKGAEGICPDGATCGGDPSGTWDSAGLCQYETNRPDQSLNPNEQVQKPVIASLNSSHTNPTTSGDWCQQLIYTPLDKVKAVNLWHDAPPMAGGSITYNKDYTYSVALNFSGYNISHFAPYCLQAGGAHPTCEVLAQDLSAYYLKGASMDAGGNPLPDFTGVACVTATDSGCDCGYTYQVALTNKGTYNFGGSVLTQSSAPDAFLLNGKSAGSQGPSSVMVSSFCQNGAQLTLSGYNGTTLFHVPGLRVLTLNNRP